MTFRFGSVRLHAGESTRDNIRLLTCSNHHPRPPRRYTSMWTSWVISALLGVFRPSFDLVDPVKISVRWEELHPLVSKTSLTLQVVANPLVLRNSSIHKRACESLNLVSSDYIRFVPWFPYPLLSVPALEPPRHDILTGECTTSWNITYMDEMMADLYAATPGVKHIINFSTTPAWMWITDHPVEYPKDVNAIDFEYNQGTNLRDPSMREISEYYARVVGWYVNGGFIDECGQWRESGHKYDIEYWEVLNEPDAEHSWSPEMYNRLYDSVTTAIHRVSPDTEFVGMAATQLELLRGNYTFFETFLDADKHRPGTRLDWMSYHFYAQPSKGSDAEKAKASFAQADDFVEKVKAIDQIKRRIQPSIKTHLNEIGTFDPDGGTEIVPGYEPSPEYWVWSGGIYAYIFSQVSKIGIEAIGESQLIGYPGQFPSVSMVNYTTGAPTARLRVLQLLQDNFGPGDEILPTQSSGPSVHAQAYRDTSGKRKLLLINKSGNEVCIDARAFKLEGKACMVDVASGEGVWHQTDLEHQPKCFTLSPFATAVLGCRSRS